MSGAASASSHTAERAPRHARLITAEIWNHRIGSQRIIVRNISSTGLGGKSRVPLEVGEEVNIHLPDHPRTTGIVRWYTDGQFGIELDQRVEPASTLHACDPTAFKARDSDHGFAIYEHVGNTYRPTLTFGGHRGSGLARTS